MPNASPTEWSAGWATRKPRDDDARCDGASKRTIGATEYVFDPALPLFIRGLSLFHVATPLLMGWGLVRFGYDRREFVLQLVTSVVLLPISYAFGPTLDINWTWGPFERRQTWVPSPIWFVACLIGYPVLLYWPSHLALCWLVPRIRARLANQ